MAEKFSSGDKIDWREGMNEQALKLVGQGPFIVGGVEDYEPDGEHCQYISIFKEDNGKMLAWVEHKQAWVEYRKGPMYVAVPPVFSNTNFRKV